MKNILSHIFYDVFLTSLTVFFLSLRIGAQGKGALAMWGTLNVLLVICLVSGILSVLLPVAENHNTRIGVGYWLGALVISAGTGFIAYKKIEELEIWAYLFAGAVTLIIFFISYALAGTSETKEESSDSSPRSLNPVP